MSIISNDNYHKIYDENLKYTDTIKKTKQLIKERRKYKNYISSFNNLTIEPTFKLPDLPSFPILKNTESISLMKIDSYKGFDYNHTILMNKIVNKEKNINIPKEYSPFKNKKSYNMSYYSLKSCLSNKKIDKKNENEVTQFSLLKQYKSPVRNIRFDINSNNEKNLNLNLNLNLHIKTKSIPSLNLNSNIIIENIRMNSNDDIATLLNIDKEYYKETSLLNYDISKILYNFKSESESNLLNSSITNVYNRLKEYNIDCKSNSSIIFNTNNTKNKTFSSLINKKLIYNSKCKYNNNKKDKLNLKYDLLYMFFTYITNKINYLSQNNLENLTCFKEDYFENDFQLGKSQVTIKIESIKILVSSFMFTNDYHHYNNFQYNKNTSDQEFINGKIPNNLKGILSFIGYDELLLPFDILPLIYSFSLEELKYFISQVLELKQESMINTRHIKNNNNNNNNNNKKENQFNIFHQDKKKGRRNSAIERNEENTTEEIYFERVILNLSKVKCFLQHDNFKEKLEKRIWNDNTNKLNINFTSLSQLIDSNIIKISLITKFCIHELQIVLPNVQLRLEPFKKVFYKYIEIERIIQMLMNQMENWSEDLKIYFLNNKQFRDEFRKVFSLSKKEKDKEKVNLIDEVTIKRKIICKNYFIFSLKKDIFNSSNSNSNKTSSYLNLNSSLYIEKNTDNKSKLNTYDSFNNHNHMNNDKYKYSSQINSNTMTAYDFIDLNKFQIESKLDSKDEYYFIIVKSNHFLFYCLSSYSIKVKSNEMESIIFLSLRETQIIETIKTRNILSLMKKLIIFESTAEDSSILVPKLNRNVFNKGLSYIKSMFKSISLREDSEIHREEVKSNEDNYKIEYNEPRFKYKFILIEKDGGINLKEEGGIIIHEHLMIELKEYSVDDWGFILYLLYDMIELDNKLIVGNKMKFNFAAKFQSVRKKRIEREQKEKEEEIKKKKRISIIANKLNIMNLIFNKDKGNE